MSSPFSSGNFAADDDTGRAGGKVNNAVTPM
jgi:hypothetical protein